MTFLKSVSNLPMTHKSRDQEDDVAYILLYQKDFIISPTYSIRAYMETQIKWRGCATTPSNKG